MTALSHPARGGLTAPRRLLPLLVLVSMVGPLSLNILAPSLPGLVTAFASDRDSVQLTLSLYLAGTAVSQLLLGPLTDRFGRRPVLLLALALYVVASAAAIYAQSIGLLVVARVVQAFGAMAGITIGRTIIRDLYGRDEAASLIGYVTMVMVVAPMVAPVLGGTLDDSFGWRSIFVFCAAMGAVVLAVALLRLPETRPESIVGSSFADVGRRSAELVRQPAFVAYVGTSAFGSGVFFAFQGGAPYLVIDVMGQSKTAYGFWFMAVAGGYMVGNFLSGRLARSYGSDRLITIGNVLTLVGALALLPFALAGSMHPGTLFLPCLLTSVGNGLVLPNAIAGGVSVDPKAAGAASGLMGFVQMGIGAIASYTAGLITGTSAVPLTLLMSFCAVAALAFTWRRLRTGRST
jgi:DHA1 family bicyclomycin/chloramphenicol resistance-like MFS transporter